MKDYEKYQLQWMLDHDRSLRDLVKELEDRRQDHHPEAPLQDVYTDWEMNSGFDGSIWACEDEWNDAEKGLQKQEGLTLPYEKGGMQFSLVAEDVGDKEFSPEIVIGIKDKDNWLQDLAIVRLREKETGDGPFAEVLPFDPHQDDYQTAEKIDILL